MVTDILKAYQFRSKLGRMEFIVGVLALTVFLGVATLLTQRVFFSPPDRSYFVFKAALGIITTILVLPLVVARLRDIGWNPFVSLLIFVPLPFDPRWLLLYAPEGGGSIRIPEWVILIKPTVFFVYLFFLLTVFFWKGRITRLPMPP